MNLLPPPDETLRQQALNDLDILDTAPEASFDRLTALAARLFGVPIVLVSLVDRDRQWFKSCYGLDTRETSRDVSFCAHAILSEEVMVVPDATKDPRFAANPLVTGEVGLRFYAGAPLRASNGHNLGSLCLIDTSPRDFSAQDRKSLSDMAALVVDEMELRVSKTQLEQSQNRLRSLIDSTSDIISVLDERGIIGFESQSVCKILGYEPQEMVGCDVLNFVHPDDAEALTTNLQLALQSTLPWPPLPVRFRHRDGSYRVLELIGKNCLADPGVKGFVVSSRDISGRKQIDERLRLLESVVTQTNDTVIITEIRPCDEPGPRILYVNEAFTRLSGYSAAEAVGRSPRFLQGPDTLRSDLDQLRRAIETYQSTCVEVVNYRKDGSPFWAEMSLNPVADENGEFTHWISIQRDVTARRHAQDALEADKAEAEIARQEAEIGRNEAERASFFKSEFVSRMSHELRTPLNSILGFGQLLEMSELADEDQDSVEQILRGGRHLLGLINEILDITQIETGNLSLSLQVVSAGLICTEALSLVKSVAGQRGISLLNRSPHCALNVMADQKRLTQVLLNLLSNAVKYGPENGTVSLWCEQRKGGSVRFSVRDEGAGIPLDKQHRLFTPYDRLGVESGGVQGTGLGLALSQRLTEAMNGALGFESAPEQGSVFWVDLPLAKSSLPTFNGLAAVSAAVLPAYQSNSGAANNSIH